MTAAAVIMFSAFGSFVMGSHAITKALGLSRAVGMLVDAFVVRMTTVPAEMELPGLVVAARARSANEQSRP